MCNVHIMKVQAIYCTWLGEMAAHHSTTANKNKNKPLYIHIRQHLCTCVLIMYQHVWSDLNVSFNMWRKYFFKKSRKTTQ